MTATEKSRSVISPEVTAPVAFIICVLGIYASYFGFGVIQQTLNETEFGEDKKKFRNTTFLLFMQCVGNCVCAIFTMVVKREQQDKTPFGQYALVAGSYVGAMFASNLAIQYVSYPMKELAKACKPIPVTSGIVVYMWDEISHSKGSVETSLYGVLLLLGSLALDGITGPFQDDLVGKYRPSSQAMMYYTNLWAAIYTGAGMCVSDWITCISFACYWKWIGSAIGQNFIYYTVNRFGSLVCSLVTTTRKFFSILISSLLFAKPLTVVEWVGVFIVFAGLGVDIYSSSKRTHKKEE